MEPPDPFPNSEVKRLSADGSVVRPCESRSSSAPYLKPPYDCKGVLFMGLLFGAMMKDIKSRKYIIGNTTQQGVTLLEVMTVLGVISVLVTVAYPAVIGYLQGAEARRVENVLLMAMKEARLLSQTTKNNVVVCLADEQQRCNRLAGHQVLLIRDSDDNQRIDKPAELLKAYPLSLKYGTVEMRASLLRSHMKYFWDTGAPRGHFGHVKYCSVSRKARHSYQVVVNSAGWVWVKEGCGG